MPNWPLERIKSVGWVDNDPLDPDDLSEIDRRILHVADSARHQGLEQWSAYATIVDHNLAETSTGVGAYREIDNNTVGLRLATWKLNNPGGVPTSVPQPERRLLVAFGNYGALDQPFYACSSGGMHWEHRLSGTTNYAIGDSGSLIRSTIGFNSVVRVPYYDGPFQTIPNVVAAGHSVVALHWSSGTDRLLAGDSGGSNTDKVVTSDDDGETWIPRTFVSNWVPWKFVDNGDGTILALAYAPGGIGGANPKLVRSTNDGNTWSSVINSALPPGDQNILNDSLAAVGDCSIAYVPDYGAFVAIAGDKVYRSYDTFSWDRLIVSAFGIFPRPFGQVGVGGQPSPPNDFLIGVGPVLAARVNWNISNIVPLKHRPGVIYSFDLGGTWKFVGLGPTNRVAKHVGTIKEWNGRLVVGAPGIVYISGLLPGAIPPVDFSADG